MTAVPDYPIGDAASDNHGRGVSTNRNRGREAERRRRQRERAKELAFRELARRERSDPEHVRELTRLMARARHSSDPAWTEFYISAVRAALGYMPVSIYISDEKYHEKVEASVEQWLAEADVFIDARDEPVIGSWFRRMEARVRKAANSPAGREAILTVTHMADSHLVQTQDAYVTSTLLQNVGPVLQALQPTKDAVVRAGALLIVKIDWVVQVHQLTAAQQAILDHQPKLTTSPTEILAALEALDPVLHEAAVQSSARHNNGGETAATATN